MAQIPEIIQRFFKAELSADEICSNRTLIREYTSSKRKWKKAYEFIYGSCTQYRYLVTFTVDPRKSGHKSTNEIYDYIYKQFKRTPLQVKQAYIVQEGDGKKKHIHWHVAVETNKALKKDRFNYYTKKYGNIDISKTKAETLQHALKYISKEAEPQCIIKSDSTNDTPSTKGTNKPQEK